MALNHRLEEAVKAGINIPRDGYWGDIPSKICGAYAGEYEEKEVKEATHMIKNKIAKNE